MPPISMGSTWKFIGSTMGRGEIHTVVGLGKEKTDLFKPAGDRIITIGIASNGVPSHSFFGEPGQFYLEFTPVQGEK